MNYQVYGNELYHHGILGQKWGVRRFQNPDGSLTPAGKKRYKTSTSLTTKNGETIYLNQLHGGRIKEDVDYDIFLSDGRKIGNLFLEDHGDDLYVNWIDINKKERGKTMLVQ